MNSLLEIALFTPKSILSPNSWVGHLPFAAWLIREISPRNFVELGTHTGNSYFSFCQSVAEADLPTKCYAVDTWQGEEHAGLYDDEIFNQVSSYNQENYIHFSSLLKMSFDEALDCFEEGSIDLLHIDGLHTYEAVKHDFESWLPMLAPGAVVLFHDTKVRERNFGVWKLWEELQARYPDNFEFSHSHGLGILQIEVDRDEEKLTWLDPSPQNQTQFKNYFSALGLRQLERFELIQFRTDVDQLTQVVNEHDEKIAELNQTTVERDIQIGELTQVVNERDEQICELCQTATERNEQITELNQVTVERDIQIGELTQIINERNEQIGELSHVANERDIARAEIDSILSSRCWRMTKPARVIITSFRQVRVLLFTGFWRFTAKKAISWCRSNRRLPTPREFYTLAQHARQKYQVQLNMSFSSENSTTDLLLELNIRSGESPLISVVMPVYKTPVVLLERAVNSVRTQIYHNWELCICDDGSSDLELKGKLQSLAQADRRIKVAYLESNSGISHATNTAIVQATGDFIAFLDHDDELTPNALGEVVLAIRSNPNADVFYTDQDKIDELGVVFEQFHKPDWSPDYFRRVMYIGHLLVVKSNSIKTVGGLNSQFDGIQDYELMLRLSEEASQIIHIPKILYHWRAIQGSFALSSDAKGTVEKIQCEAVRKHLGRLGMEREVSPHPKFSHRVKIGPLNSQYTDKVSIIIPTKDQPDHLRRCLSSIFNKTTYKNFEVIIIDNNTVDKEALHILQQYPVQVIPYHDQFNYSKVNNIGVDNASGDVVVLLNNDIEVITGDWLEVLLASLCQDDVGVVGPMLVYPDKTVQHAGIVLGARGTVDHVMRGIPCDCDGYAGSLSCTREVSAVTGACLMTRKKTYIELGGLVEHYGTHYQDADYCLQVRERGLRILHVPDVCLIHFESATRGTEYDLLDRLLFQDRWDTLIKKGDPYFHSAFSLSKLDYSIDT